ncbi:hypothetical protein GGS20DRAFT_580135 [Poronia punctata]|nr:hypothetical protein GGS20DRAFT_580135 [Poronia punctata]
MSPDTGAKKRRDDKEEDQEQQQQEQQKKRKRRRAFSCLSCQRLKCRCEYDVGANGCHRCQTLRISCSLRGQRNDFVTPPGESPGEVAAVVGVARPSAGVVGLGVEERLQRHEDALEEIKTMIQALKPPENSNRPNSSEDVGGGGGGGAARGSHDPPDPAYLSNPVDRGSKSAPIVVLREMTQSALGYPRLLGHGNLDLVQLQLLDEQTASELIETFIRYQSHTLLVRSNDDLRHGGETRRVSAFLHSVCCLIGVVYRDDICGTELHRQIYDQVRMTLGQAALSSPLDLDDLNAMFIMSNNANTPNGQGVEYIDSWLLTGYCAKQAMLSIYFTHIVNRLQKGSSTVEDHRAMHLWCMICLHHLHWAATTGRPSIIPKGYIDQCNVLLSFYQATMQDGMLVAEIMLYSILHQKILHESYPSDGGECEEFRAWKQKWNHLLTLPTSAMLRIGYHAACLILAVRVLGKTGDAPGSTSFLSTENTPRTTDDRTPGREQQHEHKHHGRDESAHLPGAKKRTADESSQADDLLVSIKVNTCKYAKLILETFVEMPTFLMDATETCTCLCLGYCALLLAHYDASQSRIPDAVVLRLVTRLYSWVRASPGRAWANKYPGLARQKVEARINAGMNFHDRGETNMAGQDRLDGRDESGSHDRRNIDGYHVEDVLGDHHPVDADESLPSFDLGAEAMFPSMEGFFGGGFLDFMK